MKLTNGRHLSSLKPVLSNDRRARLSLWRRVFIRTIILVFLVYRVQTFGPGQRMLAAEAEGNCVDNCSRNQAERVGADERHWQTETQDSYPARQSDLSKCLLGRRRELVKNFIGLRVFGETMNAIVAGPPPQPVSPSEYVENFCDSKFTPFMDRTEYDIRKHKRYPLHGGAAVQSYYKSQLDSGTLKARSEITNFNEPFRRSCSFTTPPDLALREPTGGF